MYSVYFFLIDFL